MRSDESHLLDMLLAARKIKRFAADLTEQGFRESEIHQSAIIRELQVIGEAARLVSEPMKTQHPEMQWVQIAGMRNRLIHEYFRVDLKLVWQVVEQDIDALILRLEPLIPKES